jgi:hypothetical protein
MFDLQSFTLTQMIILGSALRKLDKGAGSMEETANRIVRHLYDQVTSRQTDQRACVLIRLFKTRPCSR